MITAILLNVRFIQLAWRLLQEKNSTFAMPVFRFSIIYLILLFTALIVDHDHCNFIECTIYSVSVASVTRKKFNIRNAGIPVFNYLFNSAVYGINCGS